MGFLVEVDVKVIVMARGLASGEAEFGMPPETKASFEMGFDQDLSDAGIGDQYLDERLGPLLVEPPWAIRRRVGFLGAAGTAVRAGDLLALPCGFRRPVAAPGLR